MICSTPFVVEVQDQNGAAFKGVPVRFVTTGDETLSVEDAVTDTNGRAQSTLILDKKQPRRGSLQIFSFESSFILGRNLGTHTVEVTVAKIPQTQTFTATVVTPLVSLPNWIHKLLGRLKIKVKSPLVDLPEPNLRANIEKALGKESGDPITESEMAALTQISRRSFWEMMARPPSFSDLTGLESATNLKRLHIAGYSISDISVLSRLTKLKWLWLDSNAVSDISTLSHLTNLKILGLKETSVSDISVLSRLTKLKRLWLEGSSISDISVLSRLTKLKGLGLDSNAVSDISALSRLIKLKGLWLKGSSISDISVLSRLTKLKDLWLKGSSISDISALSRLTKLTELVIEGRLVSDISALWGLTSLRALILRNTSISDFSVLKGLINLRRLVIEGRSVSDISTLWDLTSLRTLVLRNTSISDVSVLKGLTNLTELNLTGNSISDVSVLKGLTKLKTLDLGNNLVSDLSALLGLTKLESLSLKVNSWNDQAGNPLSYQSIHAHIPTLQSRGVWVHFDDRTPTTLLKISGDNPLQQGAGTTLVNPFIVEVRDQNDAAFEGVPVTFTVTSGGGTLSVENAETDANGRAQSTLTLGTDVGENTVEVTVEDIQQTQIFTANAVNN